MDFTYKGDKSALLLSPTVRRSVYVYDQYSRIFSCGNFESTGRLYDHWFQQIPSLIRKYTLIDGNYCTMYDFSAMGLNILYSVMGIKPESKDFYNLGGQFLKKDIKLATNIMLNTCSYRQAICTIEYEGIKDARGLVMAIQVKHSKVKKGFFKEMGLKGQITESDMAIEIMTIMLESGMPCLSVHDGFATTTKYKNELLKIINSVAKKYISHEVAVKEEFSLT